jgi:hypothetical protein
LKEIKRAARELQNRGKAGMREIDGHTVSDDVGNAGDTIRKDIANAGDDARGEARKARARTDEERATRRTTR